jgi:D-alanyl-lipoteichoic acid acyltransferase DltB (MBOAT superfamily)
MNLSKKLGEKSKYLARIVPACIGNVLIFLIVGIWHGAEWHFIFWGLYQGLIIAFSTIMEPFFKKINVFLHVDEKALYWKIFRIIRTFLIILIGYILDEISDLHQMLGMTKQLFSFTNGNLIENFSYDGFGILTILVVFLFSAIWFIVSIMKERGIDVRKKIAAFPLFLRWGIYLALILSTPFFQASDALGFMYANF